MSIIHIIKNINGGAGTPVMSFNVGGFPDFIDHRSNGFLVNNINSENLKENIIWFSNFKSQIKSRQQIVLDFNKKIEKAKIVEKHIKIYGI